VEAAIADNKEQIKPLLAPDPSVPVDPRPHRWRHPWLWGGAIAASLAILVAGPLLRSRVDPVVYENNGATNHSLSLANGTNVILAPSSKIIVTGQDAGAIELAQGEAYFDVRHDPGRTLTVSAGSYRISDIGTRFSVNLASGTFRVGVAEGMVSVNAPGADKPVRLDAGHQLVGGTGKLTLAPVDVAQIGSWRNGRLSYTDAPLPLVAADISRYSGKTIIVDPSVEKKHFSGNLVIGDGSKLVGDLAGVMGIEAQMSGNAVHLGPVR
jgi:transmembrane sensor